MRRSAWTTPILFVALACNGDDSSEGGGITSDVGPTSESGTASSGTASGSGESSTTGSTESGSGGSSAGGGMCGGLTCDGGLVCVLPCEGGATGTGGGGQPDPYCVAVGDVMCGGNSGVCGQAEGEECSLDVEPGCAAGCLQDGVLECRCG